MYSDHFIAEGKSGGRITVEVHRWYAVIREDVTVIGVIGRTSGEGVAFYDTVEEWEAEQ